MRRPYYKILLSNKQETIYLSLLEGLFHFMSNGSKYLKSVFQSISLCEQHPLFFPFSGSMHPTQLKKNDWKTLYFRIIFCAVILLINMKYPLRRYIIGVLMHITVGTYIDSATLYIFFTLATCHISNNFYWWHFMIRLQELELVFGHTETQTETRMDRHMWLLK